jgi:hypothetical protein
VDRSLLSITSKRNVERDLLLKAIRMCGITVLKGAWLESGVRQPDADCGRAFTRVMQQQQQQCSGLQWYQ